MIFIILNLISILTYLPTEIHIPNLPSIASFYNINEESSQLIVSLNFLGIALSSFFGGALSDSLGRRKIIIFGLSIYIISNIILVNSYNFDMILLGRLFLGIGAGFMNSVAFPIVIDHYPANRTSQLFAMWNSIFTSILALAPLIGGFIGNYYGWHANFTVILLLSLIAGIIIYFKLPETLSEEKRKEFHISKILDNYYALISNKEFIAKALINIMPFAGLMTYISNSSLIYINHFKLDAVKYSYYQSSLIVVIMLFSVISVKILKEFGNRITAHIGVSMNYIGMILLLILSLFEINSVNYLNAAMMIYCAGTALSAGITGSEAIQVIPSLYGTANSLCGCLRLSIVSFLLYFSGNLYNGTMLPISITIAIAVTISLTLYIKTHKFVKN